MTTLIPKINFKNGGSTPTGAVTRAIDSKLQDTVSVKDFGAIGDGTTDDTTAIQNALNSGVPFVLMPPGTYLVTSTLTIASANITLSGQSGGTQAYQTATINHSSSSTGPLFRLDSSSNGGACLRNFNVTGGNGSFCIISSRPYVRYEYIHMETYTGSGIQLLYSGGGSSSSEITQCQWVGPNSATAYTGYEIDVNGGDVAINHCTAIRGAIGLNIIRGQTVIVNRFSANKQSKYSGFSSASQFNTAGIKLSGSGLKQAISIRNSYIEVCDNGVYVESCESLSIEDNWFDDGGAAGTVGAYTSYGNSAINLVDNTCKNVTIRNNDIQSNSASNTASTSLAWRALRLNNASNVIVVNNNISTLGDNSSAYYVTTPTTAIAVLNNTYVPSVSFAYANYDPNGKLANIVTSPITITPSTAWAATTAASGWTNTSGRYFKDALGYVHLSGYMAGGSGLMTTLPSGFYPAQQESFVVNASGALGVVTVFTNGQVSLTSGTSTYVYLSPITFSTT
jgi:hypothetical protein